ncbi:MAG: hypothetical protein JJT87_13735 [Halomonas sp.]|nr:hypothetical protein [Halomonas sp.]MCC5902973.1 hypothetical protein [Halomonas sp.]
MKKTVLKVAKIQAAFFKLLKLKDGWAEDIPKLIRFILLAVSSFFTYGIYKALGGLELSQINLLLDKYFCDPTAFGIGSYVAVWSALGLYSSLLTAALAASLVPRP